MLGKYCLPEFHMNSNVYFAGCHLPAVDLLVVSVCALVAHQYRHYLSLAVTTCLLQSVRVLHLYFRIEHLRHLLVDLIAVCTQFLTTSPCYVPLASNRVDTRDSASVVNQTTPTLKDAR